MKKTKTWICSFKKKKSLKTTMELWVWNLNPSILPLWLPSLIRNGNNACNMQGLWVLKKATISIFPPSRSWSCIHGLSTLLLSRSSTQNSLGFCNCFSISSFLLTQWGFLFCYQNPDVTRSHNKKKAGEKRKMSF